MANLTDEHIDKVLANVMKKYSDIRRSVPITKNQLRALLLIVDNRLDEAEIAIVSDIPPGAEKSWLLQNAEIARNIITLIEDKRTEVL